MIGKERRGFSRPATCLYQPVLFILSRPCVVLCTFRAPLQYPLTDFQATKTLSYQNLSYISVVKTAYRARVTVNNNEGRISPS